VVLFGGVMVGAAWMINAVASSLAMLYLAAAVGGIGAGAVYGTCIGNALKWFSDLRGLAAGLTAAGFGAGSALTVIPIQSMIAAGGYEAAFLQFGLGQGVVVCVISWFLRAPRVGEVDAASLLTMQPAGRHIRRWRWSAHRSSGSCTSCSYWSAQAA